MKTFTKLSGLGALALGAAIGLTGCAESNDNTAVKSPTGGKGATGVVPPGTPKGSDEAYKAQQANNPMNQGGYQH